MSVPGFGDRELRYTLATVKRLKEKIGTSILRGAGLRDLDEDKLIMILQAGLEDGRKEGQPEITEADLFNLPTAMLPYLIECLHVAFLGQAPPKKAAAEPAAETLQ